MIEQRHSADLILSLYMYMLIGNSKLLSVTISLFLVACGGGGESGGFAGATFSIVANGKIYSNTDALIYKYDPFENQTLLQLRQNEKLDDIFIGGSEFEKILRLKNWVKSQWNHSVPSTFPPYNAVVILDWIRSGQTGGWCGQYAIVLLQSLLSLGYQARYIEIGHEPNPYAHFIIEVWSNQYSKWIALDADYNVHWEAHGVPLSGLEIHDAYVNNKVNDLDVIKGERRDPYVNPDWWPNKMSELFYYYRVTSQMEHLTRRDDPISRLTQYVEWNDDLTVPWEFSTYPSQYPKEKLTDVSTNRREVVDAKLNQVVLSFLSVTPYSVQLSLTNNSVEFKLYELLELDKNGNQIASYQTTASSYQWYPSSLNVQLQIRAMNSVGVYGPPSVVSFK
jgi:hypothetical protein